MSKLVRIDEECESILRKYSDGSLSDCIRVMETKILNTTSKDILRSCGFDEAAVKTIITAIDKRMDKYESGQQKVNSELILRLSSLGGHSAPQEGSNHTYGPGVSESSTSGFRRATLSLREEK